MVSGSIAGLGTIDNKHLKVCYLKRALHLAELSVKCTTVVYYVIIRDIRLRSTTPLVYLLRYTNTVVYWKSLRAMSPRSVITASR